MGSEKEDAANSIKRALKSHKPFKYQLAAESILADCLDRRGIKNEFRQLDEEVLNVITATWQEIIRQCIEEFDTKTYNQKSEG